MRSGSEHADLSDASARGVAHHWSAIDSVPLLIAPAREPPLNDLRTAEWVHAYDAAWLDKDWERLERFMTRDVALRIHRQRQIVAGRAAVVGYLKDFMGRARVTDYSATDLRGSFRSDGTGLITCSWYLQWIIGKRRRACAGNDRLCLVAGRNGWLLRARSVWMEPLCAR